MESGKSVCPIPGDLKTAASSPVNIALLLLDFQAEEKRGIFYERLYCPSSMFKRTYENAFREQNPINKAGFPKPGRDETIRGEMDSCTAGNTHSIIGFLAKELRTS
nr:hypothetical protein [uncultured Oscillibacter sp.]